MPIYAYKCPQCGSEKDDFNRIDDRHTNAPACACGTQMAMQFTPVRGSVQQDAHYVCPATGEQVTSWRQRRETFARHGLIDARDMDKSYREQKTKAKRDRLEKALRECPQVIEAEGRRMTASDILGEQQAG